jgi:hypothetical protein
MLKPTLGAKVWFWKRRAQAAYLLDTLKLTLAVIRYHLLCFKHFGWRRLAIFLLETPEHLRAVFLALFSLPPHMRAPADQDRT